MKQRHIPNPIVTMVLCAVVLCLSLPPVAFADPFAPFLGLFLKELDDDLRKRLDYKGDGILIEAIIENTGAARSDLKPEDIITAIDGKKITRAHDIKEAISATKLGDKVKITVLRGKQDKVIAVEVSNRGKSVKEHGRKWVYFPKEDRPWVGISMEELNPQLAAYFGTGSGVLITEVSKDSPAQKAKLSAGDVIIQWNGEKIENEEQIFKRLDGANAKDTVHLMVMRKGKQTKIKIILGQPNPEATHGDCLGDDGHDSKKGDAKHSHPGIEKGPMPFFECPPKGI